MFCPMHYCTCPPGFADAAAGERVDTHWGEVGKSDCVPHLWIPRHEVQVREKERHGSFVDKCTMAWVHASTAGCLLLLLALGTAVL